LETPFGDRFGLLGVAIHALRKQLVLFVRSKYLEVGLIRKATNALNAVALEGENWTDVIGWARPNQSNKYHLAIALRDRDAEWQERGFNGRSAAGPSTEFSQRAMSRVLQAPHRTYQERSWVTWLNACCPQQVKWNVAVIEVEKLLESRECCPCAGGSG
jgi:hypothetical protein